MGHKAAEVTTNDAVPGGTLALIELNINMSASASVTNNLGSKASYCTLDVLRNVLS
jgi:hypothetical protein